MVVIATGAWTQPLLAAQGVAMPVGMERLQVLATVPRPLDIHPVVYGPLAAKQYSLFRDLPSWDEPAFLAPYEIESGRWMLQLLSQRANGEVLLGCPMDYPPEVTHEVTLSGLRDTATAISDDFPGLRDVGIDRMWAGVLPFTSDLVPIIDEVTPGLFVAAGHVFGNASGPMTGKLVGAAAPRQGAGRRHDGVPLGPRPGADRARRQRALVSSGAGASSRGGPGPPTPAASSTTSTSRCATRCAGSSSGRCSRSSPSGSGATTTRATSCRPWPRSACSACPSPRSTVVRPSTSSATRSSSRSWPEGGWAWPASSAARRAAAGCSGASARTTSGSASSPTWPPAGA